MLQKRGRPRKDVDAGVIFHMLKNNAPITAVAKHIGIHRDTIYANFKAIIDEARVSHREAWRKIADEMFEKWKEKRKLADKTRKEKKRSRYLESKRITREYSDKKDASSYGLFFPSSSAYTAKI